MQAARCPLAIPARVSLPATVCSSYLPGPRSSRTPCPRIRDASGGSEARQGPSRRQSLSSDVFGDEVRLRCGGRIRCSRPTRPVDDHSVMQSRHGLAADGDTQCGDEGVQEAGQSPLQHRYTETRGALCMLEVRLADRSGMIAKVSQQSHHSTSTKTVRLKTLRSSLCSCDILTWEEALNETQDTGTRTNLQWLPESRAPARRARRWSAGVAGGGESRGSRGRAAL